MEKEHLAKGTLLFHGTYRIEGKLGQGGFGITYLATDVALDKYVAIKEFFPNTYCKRDTSTSRVGVATEGSREFVTKLKLKFLKEARNIAKLDHPNIVRLHAAFEENDTAYYVMDYIEGTPLSQIVKTHGPLDRCKAVEYATLIGNALVYLHKRRINHLDVKPANIMVRKRDGVPVLIDFGLAKQYDCEGQQTTSTPVGFSQGFAPVEQYKPGGVKEFSPTSDLYSLAATLYFMLSGRIPPPATDLVDELLTFPEEFPSDLKKPIEKAMSASRKSRHATVEQFLREINPDRQAPPPSPEEDTTFENTTYEEPAVEATVDDDEEIFEPKKVEVQKTEIPEKPKEPKKKMKINWRKFLFIGLGFSVLSFIIWIVVLFFLGVQEKKAAPYDVSGKAGGHEYVDLGLPSGTLWAISNLEEKSILDKLFKAEVPWVEGDRYDWRGNKFNSPSPRVIPPSDVKNISGTEYDAARRVWGGDWRVPTVEEMEELVSNTDFEWTEVNGVRGGKFTARNGNSLFIPCQFYGELYVWSSTEIEDGTGGYGIFVSYGRKEEYYISRSDYSSWLIGKSLKREYKCIRPVMSPNRK